MLVSQILSLVLLASEPISSAEPLPDGICCGATCCLIDGACQQTGDANPADACLVCDPGQSSTQWSDADTPMCEGGGDTTGTSDSSGDDGGSGCSIDRTAGPLGAGLIALLAFRRRRR